MTTNSPRRRLCSRAGCRLPRWLRREDKGRSVRFKWCSEWCHSWATAAQGALQAGDERQAATLLEAASVLDHRASGADSVHGVQIIDGTRWIVHAGAHTSRKRHRRTAA